MEYYPQKKKEILSFAVMEINLEEILSEIGQSQKDKHCLIPLIQGI